MNIILLSGGSGKRLWPLSNSTRSKQFLQLLKNEKDEYESMLQRMYRQIKEAQADTNIVVATGASQVDSIIKQLGNKVDIVVEPERRDTFPAITLAGVYLEKGKKIPRDEAVLILPVDPYADIDYFRMLTKMERTVRENIADIVLMGIQPTYPSAKYGYIMPNKKREANPCDSIGVEYFIEKPSEEKAAQLIAEGAMWNGGVFGLRLDYLMKIASQSLPGINEMNYAEVLSNYPKFKKTSFDYEVVENAKTIRMVSYSGYWKDLGTWNTLSEEIKDKYIGEVITGEAIENTTIINELSIPLIVLGTKNVIVAASQDGILVSDKQKSSYLKAYVDKLEDNRPMFEERQWGEYKVLDYVQYHDKIHSLTKHLTIQPGKSISYQSHSQRDEIWTIVDGTGELLMDGHIRNVRRGDVAYITKGQRHALRAVTELHFIEVQIGEELQEDDIESYEWSW